MYFSSQTENFGPYNTYMGPRIFNNKSFPKKMVKNQNF